MRRLSIKYPPRLNVLNAAKTTYYIKSKAGKDIKRVSFECSKCHTKDLKSTQVAVDHIQGVVGKEGFTNIQNFVDGLFCGEANLQLLCDVCHTEKTTFEQNQRILNKKECV